MLRASAAEQEERAEGAQGMADMMAARTRVLGMQALEGWTEEELEGSMGQVRPVQHQVQRGKGEAKQQEPGQKNRRVASEPQEADETM